MGDFACPRKKPRLDETNGTFDWEFGNDDLWGQDELTAEEFDMLEVQATQAADQRNTVFGADQVGQASSSNVNADCEGDSTKWDRLKQEQYALEGKNKSLTEMLEKTTKELNEERLKREQIIDQKLTNLKQKEADLLQEIDKLQTALQFKEQEIRTERTRIHMIENKLKLKTVDFRPHPSPKNSSCHERSVRHSPVKKTPSKFPNWNSFDVRNQAKTVESGIQTETVRQRRFPLSLQSPRGVTTENGALWKLLSIQRAEPPRSTEDSKNTLNDIFRTARETFSVSLAMSTCRKEADNIWKPYEIALQEYVSCLTKKRNALNFDAVKNRLFKIPDVSYFDLNASQSSILTCLKDLARLLFHQRPKETSRDFGEPSSIEVERQSDSEELSVDLMPLFEDSKMDVAGSHHSLPELLVMLVNPSTYPDGLEKTCIIEWALAALVAWSFYSKESLESCIRDVPYHSLLSGDLGMECAYMTVKLMVQLIGLKSFGEVLSLRSDTSCVLCCVGNLGRTLHNHFTGNPPCLFVDMIENFFSGALTFYGFAIIQRTSCATQIVQFVIVMLLKQLESSQKCNLPYHLTVLEKGIILITFLATHLPNFKALRKPAEESYVALICGLTTLCKENPEFKKSQDMLRDLWDFQDDSGEFDSEEMSSPDQ